MEMHSRYGILLAGVMVVALLVPPDVQTMSETPPDQPSPSAEESSVPIQRESLLTRPENLRVGLLQRPGFYEVKLHDDGRLVVVSREEIRREYLDPCVTYQSWGDPGFHFSERSAGIIRRARPADLADAPLEWWLLHRGDVNACRMLQGLEPIEGLCRGGAVESALFLKAAPAKTKAKTGFWGKVIEPLTKRRAELEKAPFDQPIYFYEPCQSFQRRGRLGRGGGGERCSAPTLAEGMGFSGFGAEGSAGPGLPSDSGGEGRTMMGSGSGRYASDGGSQWLVIQHTSPGSVPATSTVPAGAHDAYGDGRVSFQTESRTLIAPNGDYWHQSWTRWESESGMTTAGNVVTGNLMDASSSSEAWQTIQEASEGYGSTTTTYEAVDCQQSPQYCDTAGTETGEDETTTETTEPETSERGCEFSRAAEGSCGNERPLASLPLLDILEIDETQRLEQIDRMQARMRRGGEVCRGAECEGRAGSRVGEMPGSGRLSMGTDPLARYVHTTGEDRGGGGVSPTACRTFRTSGAEAWTDCVEPLDCNRAERLRGGRTEEGSDIERRTRPAGRRTRRTR